MNTKFNGTIVETNGVRSIAGGGTGSITAANALTSLGAVAKAGDTMTGKLTLSASTSANSSINIPYGDAPTSPSLGDIWTTSTGIKMRRGTEGSPETTSLAVLGNNTFTNAQIISAPVTASAALTVTNTNTSNTPAMAAVFTTSGNTDAVRIVQNGQGGGLKIVNAAGTGESLRIEDESPESTPFVVSATGRVGIGSSPDASAALKVDSGGIKFNDNSTQKTAFTPYAFEAMDHFNGATSVLQLTGTGFNGGALTYVTPTYNAFGILRMETQNSTTVNSGARINQTGSSISFAPKGIGEFRYIARAMRISDDMLDGTIQGVFRTGIGDVINAQPNNGIYFQCINSNSVEFVTRNAGVETLTNTGFSILKDEWNTFEFILSADGLSVVAKINNNIVATHTTNITNNYTGIISFLQKQAAVAGYVRFDFDFKYIKFIPSQIPFNP